MRIAIFGWNDADKAEILDQLDEYFDATEMDVDIELELDLDQIVFLTLMIKDESLQDEERLIRAHQLIVTEYFYGKPSWDLTFWYPGAVGGTDFEREYITRLGDTNTFKHLIGLPRDRDLAADRVRAEVEKVYANSGAAPNEN